MLEMEDIKWAALCRIGYTILLPFLLDAYDISISHLLAYRLQQSGRDTRLEAQRSTPGVSSLAKSKLDCSWLLVMSKTSLLRCMQLAKGSPITLIVLMYSFHLVSASLSPSPMNGSKISIPLLLPAK